MSKLIFFQVGERNYEESREERRAFVDRSIDDCVPYLILDLVTAFIDIFANIQCAPTYPRWNFCRGLCILLLCLHFEYSLQPGSSHLVCWIWTISKDVELVQNQRTCHWSMHCHAVGGDKRSRAHHLAGLHTNQAIVSQNHQACHGESCAMLAMCKRVARYP